MVIEFQLFTKVIQLNISYAFWLYFSHKWNNFTQINPNLTERIMVKRLSKMTIEELWRSFLSF